MSVQGCKIIPSAQMTYKEKEKKYRDITGVEFFCRVESSKGEELVFNRYDFTWREFQGLDLRGVVFKDVVLHGVEFHNVNLEGASFIDVELTLAMFINTNLKGVKFINVDFSNADFYVSTLKDVSLKNINIGSADFVCCNIDDSIRDIIRGRSFYGREEISRFEEYILYKEKDEYNCHRISNNNQRFLKKAVERAFFKNEIDDILSSIYTLYEIRSMSNKKRLAEAIDKFLEKGNKHKYEEVSDKTKNYISLEDVADKSIIMKSKNIGCTISNKVFNNCIFIACEFIDCEFIACEFNNCYFFMCDLNMVSFVDTKNHRAAFSYCYVKKLTNNNEKFEVEDEFSDRSQPLCVYLSFWFQKAKQKKYRLWELAIERKNLINKIDFSMYSLEKSIEVYEHKLNTYIENGMEKLNKVSKDIELCLCTEEEKRLLEIDNELKKLSRKKIYNILKKSLTKIKLCRILYI